MMNKCNNFVEMHLDDEMKSLAVKHAFERTQEIVRQFVPKNAPLVHIESNYVGVIGELAVNKYIFNSIQIDDNYSEHKVDTGDIKCGGLVYDVKTDAIPSQYYNLLYPGNINDYDKYGCRVFTAKHLHHLTKYTGGLIFCAFKIPDDAKKHKKDGEIRNSILNNNSILIIGYATQKDVVAQNPTWYTPKNPKGKSSKYNSLNYIFHHSTLRLIRDLKS